MAGTIGSMTVFAKVDNRQFNKGLDKTKKGIKSFRSSVAGIGGGLAAAGAAFIGIGRQAMRFADQFATAGDKIAKTAARLSITTTDLQSLTFAIERQGGSANTLQTAIRTLSRQYYNLERGSSEAKDAFSALGITQEELRQLDPSDQFRLVANRLNTITDATKRAGLAQAIFGRSGMELIPLLGNLDQLEKKYDKFNFEISPEALKQSEAFKDAQLDASKAWEKFGVTILGSTPILTRALESLAGILVDIAERYESLQRKIIKFRFGYEIVEPTAVAREGFREFEKLQKRPPTIVENKQIPLLEKEIQTQKELIESLNRNNKSLAPLPQALGKGTSAQLSFLSNLKRQTVQDELLSENKRQIGRAHV